jgi:hypothetical protein
VGRHGEPNGVSRGEEDSRTHDGGRVIKQTAFTDLDVDDGSRDGDGKKRCKKGEHLKWSKNGLPE